MPLLAACVVVGALRVSRLVLDGALPRLGVGALIIACVVAAGWLVSRQQLAEALEVPSDV